MLKEDVERVTQAAIRHTRGKRIKQLRYGKGMTQEEFSKEFKVTRSTISKWELGILTPHLRHYIRMNKLWGVSLDVMLFGVTQVIYPRDTNSQLSIYKRVEPIDAALGRW